MRFRRTLLALFLITSVALTTMAEEQKPLSKAEVAAKRQLHRYDKDGNGRIEKHEDAKVWVRLRKLDKNRDGALTLEELKAVKVNYVPSKGEQKLEILYKQTSEGKALHLDLYYPTKEKRAAKCPLLVYTHGGGWAAGSKQGAAVGTHGQAMLELLDAGFCVASVNYRLYRREGTVAMRDCVIDSKDAVRYLCKNSQELGIDPQRVYTLGDSAGGHIAQMLLLSSPDSLPGDPDLAGAPYRMVAGVSYYGPCDFEDAQLFNHDDRPDFRDRFGARILPPDTDPKVKLARYREMGPINYLTKNSPPLLMIQGDKDTTIPVKHAYHMQKKAEALNAPVEIMIIKNAGHNWRSVGAPIEPSREAIVARTVDFLVEHL